MTSTFFYLLAEVNDATIIIIIYYIIFPNASVSTYNENLSTKDMIDLSFYHAKADFSDIV